MHQLSRSANCRFQRDKELESIIIARMSELIFGNTTLAD